MNLVLGTFHILLSDFDFENASECWGFVEVGIEEATEENSRIRIPLLTNHPE